MNLFVIMYKLNQFEYCSASANGVFRDNCKKSTTYKHQRQQYRIASKDISNKL